MAQSPLKIKNKFSLALIRYCLSLKADGVLILTVPHSLDVSTGFSFAYLFYICTCWCMHKQIVLLCKRTAFVHILSKEYILEKKNFLTVTARGIKQIQYSSIQCSAYAAQNCHTANRSSACVFSCVNQNATAVWSKIYLGKSAEMHIQILCPMVQPFILTE